MLLRAFVVVRQTFEVPIKTQLTHTTMSSFTSAQKSRYAKYLKDLSSVSSVASISDVRARHELLYCALLDAEYKAADVHKVVAKRPSPEYIISLECRIQDARDDRNTFNNGKFRGLSYNDVANNDIDAIKATLLLGNADLDTAECDRLDALPREEEDEEDDEMEEDEEEEVVDGTSDVEDDPNFITDYITDYDTCDITDYTQIHKYIDKLSISVNTMGKTDILTLIEKLKKAVYDAR